MSNRTEAVVQRIHRDFDNAVAELSQRDYLEVLESVIGILEGKEECVKEELEDE